MTTHGTRMTAQIGSETIEIRTSLGGPQLATEPFWSAHVARQETVPLSRHPGWLSVLRKGLGHSPYVLEAVARGETLGILPLAYVRSPLFGRFLVSLPYLNYGGVLATDAAAVGPLIDGAVGLADELGVRFLELRHEQPHNDPRLVTRGANKVHMRRPLPPTPGELWEGLSAKVRNQIRKGVKAELTASWGAEERLDDFYHVFSRNMRDLGTPVYGRSLFRAILEHFPDRAEFCVVHAGVRPVAAALLLHGWRVTEVPSASSLREFNPACANMLLYWKLLERAVERGQGVFDFGRSTPENNTYRFKKQWGATPSPAVWQYYVRRGDAEEMRPHNPRYGRMILAWQRMPVFLTRWLGPLIVRGIP